MAIAYQRVYFEEKLRPSGRWWCVVIVVMIVGAACFAGMNIGFSWTDRTPLHVWRQVGMAVVYGLMLGAIQIVSLRTSVRVTSDGIVTGGWWKVKLAPGEVVGASVVLPGEKREGGPRYRLVGMVWGRAFAVVKVRSGKEGVIFTRRPEEFVRAVGDMVTGGVSSQGGA